MNRPRPCLCCLKVTCACSGLGRFNPDAEREQAERKQKAAERAAQRLSQPFNSLVKPRRTGDAA